MSLPDSPFERGYSSAVHIRACQVKTLRDSLTKLLRTDSDIVLIQFGTQPSELHVTPNRPGKRHGSGFLIAETGEVKA